MSMVTVCTRPSDGVMVMVAAVYSSPSVIVHYT